MIFKIKTSVKITQKLSNIDYNYYYYNVEIQKKWWVFKWHHLLNSFENYNDAIEYGNKIHSNVSNSKIFNNKTIWSLGV